MTETDMNLNGIAELDDTTSPAGDPLEPCLKAQTGFDGIVGKSADLRHVLRLVDTVARGGATVLLLGETGTGNELVARAIHNRSHRKDRPFVKVNCAAIPAGLLESEFFGHERGAFTGAKHNKVRRLRRPGLAPYARLPANLWQERR
jgi:formate hydrogenlyase transcriptional activator